MVEDLNLYEHQVIWVSMATATGAAGVQAEMGELLRMMFRQQRRRFLIAAAELELHPAQAGALLQLADALPMHQLAAELGCDNSNVTGLVDRLEARGLVARRESPTDRRVRHIVLTAAGRKLRERLLSRVGQPVVDLARLDEAEQHQLLELLRKACEKNPAA
jgi:MarR family transcriptional regulator, organic hydroperoxide resistance regulator